MNKKLDLGEEKKYLTDVAKSVSFNSLKPVGLDPISPDPKHNYSLFRIHKKHLIHLVSVYQFTQTSLT